MSQLGIPPHSLAQIMVHSKSSPSTLLVSMKIVLDRAFSSMQWLGATIE